jgi:Immunity protein family (Imm11)
MSFYALSAFPHENYETCFSRTVGHKQGDAARCRACGSFVSLLAWLPPLQVQLELPGSQFGDFAFSTAGDDFLVSELFHRVYKGSKMAGVKGFDPVVVLGVKSRRRNLPMPPNYYRVSVAYGGPALDMEASGFEWINPPTCNVCRSGNIMRWQRLALESNTWQGEDIFRPRGLSGQIMVSQRFKDTCEQNGITNAIFTPAELAGHDFYPGMKDPSELKRYR